MATITLHTPLPMPLRAVAAACLLAAATPLLAQDDAGLRTAVLLGHEMAVEANVTYQHASGQDLKLDVYRPWRESKTPLPVVLNFHGGGWVAGKREDRALTVLPWLQMGFAVINVQYRLRHIPQAILHIDDGS